MNTVSSYRALPLAEAISLSELIPSICRARIFLRCIYLVSVSVGEGDTCNALEIHLSFLSFLFLFYI